MVRLSERIAFCLSFSASPFVLICLKPGMVGKMPFVGRGALLGCAELRQCAFSSISREMADVVFVGTFLAELGEFLWEGSIPQGQN